jgi:hypothetical protein
VKQQDGRWWECDDSSVRPVEEKDIVTPMAYVLFYRRILDPARAGAVLEELERREAGAEAEAEEGAGAARGPAAAEGRGGARRPRRGDESKDVYVGMGDMRVGDAGGTHEV